jgi:hypothetical protein
VESLGTTCATKAVKQTFKLEELTKRARTVSSLWLVMTAFRASARAQMCDPESSSLPESTSKYLQYGLRQGNGQR